MGRTVVQVTGKADSWVGTSSRASPALCLALITLKTQHDSIIPAEDSGAGQGAPLAGLQARNEKRGGFCRK